MGIGGEKDAVGKKEMEGGEGRGRRGGGMEGRERKEEHVGGENVTGGDNIGGERRGKRCKKRYRKKILKIRKGE